MQLVYKIYGKWRERRYTCISTYISYLKKLMKKQILFKSFILLFIAVTIFGIRATPVMGAACSLSSVSVSPTSGNTGDTVTVSGYSQACDDVTINNSSIGIVAGPFSSPQTLSNPPENFTVNAYSHTACSPSTISSTVDANGVTTLLCGSQTVSVSLKPQSATVNVSNSCTGGTWSSSTGNTGGSGSSSFTVYPPSGGQTVTITPGSLPSGYKWNSVSPSSSQTVSPGGSIGFSLSCPTIQICPALSASPNPYQCGGTTTLSWNDPCAGATSCSASWTSSTAVSGSQVVTPNANPQTYDITCYGANGATGYASISVPMVANSCSGASVSISASPSEIDSGGSSTLSWEGKNVSSCDGSPWTSKTGASDSQLVTNILSTTSFPISCTSSVGGTDPSGSATVTVVAPNTAPVISISASPTSGTAGSVNPLITWSASGSPTSCTASDDWSGTKASSGSAYQGTLSSIKTYTYTLSCTNAYGTGTGSAQVVVSAPRIDGVCSSTHWNCSAGTSASNAGTGPWTWSCVGSGTGHTDASCSESLGGFTYSLSNGGTININRGSTQTGTVTRTAGTGTQGLVSLNVSVLPPDLFVQSISSQSCAPTCPSVITFRADNSATLGDHTVTVAGTPSSSNGPTSFIVHVNAGTAPVVSCSPSSSSALVGQPVTWSANVSGGTPPYTYVWSGTNVPTAPAPTHTTSNTTDTYPSTYTTTGLKHATVRVTDSASNFGDCTNGGYPGSDVQINFNPTFQEF